MNQLKAQKPIWRLDWKRKRSHSTKSKAGYELTEYTDAFGKPYQVKQYRTFNKPRVRQPGNK